MNTTPLPSIPAVVDGLPPSADLLQQARSAAVWFDLAQRTHLSLAGADRAKFLHNFSTNDIRALATGTGCEAFITSVQGKILGHVFVFAEADRLSLASVPGSAEKLLRHLTRYQINEEVTFEDLTASWHSLLIAGPHAARIVETLFGLQPPQENLTHATVPWQGVDVRIRRNDLLGLAGYELVVPEASSPALRAALTGVAPQAGEAVFEFLRITAGFPWYGVDLSDANLAQEGARTAVAINFRKGCYLGQEPIARIDALGHVNQEVRSLQLSSPQPLPAGTPLFADDAATKPAGQITSSAAIPGVDGAVALALVRRGSLTPGTSLQAGPGTAAVVFWNGPE